MFGKRKSTATGKTETWQLLYSAEDEVLESIVNTDSRGDMLLETRYCFCRAGGHNARENHTTVSYVHVFGTGSVRVANCGGCAVAPGTLQCLRTCGRRCVHLEGAPLGQVRVEGVESLGGARDERFMWRDGRCL